MKVWPGAIPKPLRGHPTNADPAYLNKNTEITAGLGLGVRRVRKFSASSPQVPIDGENCAEYCGRESCLSSNVGLAKKGTSLPMRFLGRFCILLIFSLAFGLICSEIPESLSLQDDTSNDFLVSSSAPKIGRVQTARREANARQDAAPTDKLPSLPLIHCTQPALASGPNLLRLLSVQRK
jgi:hypothetical protein